MTLTDKIKETNHYKSLQPLYRKLILKRSELHEIQLGINISKATSFDNWVAIKNPRHNIKMIVEELLA